MAQVASFREPLQQNAYRLLVDSVDNTLFGAGTSIVIPSISETIT
jgi:hypothetical protein